MTERWLYAHLTLHGDTAAVLDLLQREGRALLLAGLGVPVWQERAATVAVLVDEGRDARPVEVVLEMGAAGGGPGVWRQQLRWEPVDRPFSRFEGLLSFTRRGEDGGELSLVGRSWLPETAAPVARASLETVRRLVDALAGGVTAALPEVRASASPPDPARLRVRDLMTSAPLTLEQDTSVLLAAIVLLAHGHAAVPVIDAAGRVVGVLSEHDLLAREAAPRERSGTLARLEARRRAAQTVGEACSRPAVAVGPDAPVREAARLLLDHDIGRLVVTVEDRPIGVLARHDVLHAITRTPAVLQTHVEATLADLGAAAVTSEVGPDGAVRLRGAIGSRRDADRLAAAIGAVDGVTAVEVLDQPATVPTS